MESKVNVVFGFNNASAFDYFKTDYFEDTKKMRYYAEHLDTKNDVYIKVQPMFMYNEWIVYVNAYWVFKTKEDILSVFYNELNKENMPKGMYHEVYRKTVDMINGLFKNEEHE